MESDDQPLTSEKPNDEQGGSQVRSYECIFCKRGFSNAQALGGHMNIHRKDKAKLKQSSNEPSNIHKVSASLGTMEAKPGGDRSNPNWPWNIDDAFSRDETHVVHIRQLPLFAETPSYSCINPRMNPRNIAPWRIPENIVREQLSSCQPYMEL